MLVRVLHTPLPASQFQNCHFHDNSVKLFHDGGPYHIEISLYDRDLCHEKVKVRVIHIGCIPEIYF